MKDISRRKFMKLAGAAAMGAAVGSFAEMKGAGNMAEAKGIR